MKLRLFFPGKIKEKYYLEAINEYIKRLSPYVETELVYYKESKLKDNPTPGEIAMSLAEEERNIMSLLKDQDKTVILDIQGKAMTSVQFSGHMDRLFTDAGAKINVIIGSSYGLSDNIKNKAISSISLSPLTFTHQMVPLIFLEQLYRGISIQHGRTYHK